jgi:Tol biopolymer transport system component
MGRGASWLRAAGCGLAVASAAGGCRPEAGRDGGAERRSAFAVPWELVFEQEVDGNSDIYVVPAVGGPARRITEDPGHDSLARWTPDGRHIIFTSSRTGNAQLWEVPSEGGKPRRVRSNAASESQSDVSPDGRQLAFLSDLGGAPRLLVQDLVTGADREIVRHGDDTILGNPHWSPDGARIVFSSNWPRGHRIYVVDVPSRELRRMPRAALWGCEPRFTRDGREVVYVSRGFMAPRSRLVAHDLETGSERVLVDWPALNYDPAFSPDGTEVAFASNIAGEWAIFRQRLADGRAWRVTFGGPARYPDYRPSLVEER